jgi:hypothetical protein
MSLAGYVTRLSPTACLNKNNLNSITPMINRCLRKWMPCCILIILLAACHSNSSPGNFSPSDYQQQKLTIEEQEKQNPLRFLSSGGEYRQNLFGRFVLDGTIVNSATVATYKDVVIEISFYSKTETLLGTRQHPFYEYFPPGSTKTFQLKVDGYEGATKIGWEVVQAAGN